MKKYLIKIWIVSVLLLGIAATTFAADFPVTSPFGWRIHPITGEWKFHTGVDLGYADGTPIPALFDGSVVSSGNFSDGYGNQVLLYHPQIDAYTRYAHCSALYVNPGDSVYAGQIIALVGATGNATGPHLHLEYIIRSTDGGYEYTNPLVLWQ